MNEGNDNLDNQANNPPQPGLGDKTADLTPTPSYEQEPSTAAAPEVPTISDIKPPTASPNIKPDVSFGSDAPSTAPNTTEAEPALTTPAEQPSFGISDSINVEMQPADNLAENSIPVDQTTANSVAPANVLTFPAKKKRGGLIALIITLVVLLAGLAGGYFYFKSAADSAADNYTASTKTYLDNVKSAGANIAEDPIAAGNAIQAVARPQLDKVLLDFLSSKYTDAVNLESDIITNVEVVLAKISEVERVISLQQFTEQYQNLEAEAEAIITGLSGNATNEQRTVAYQEYITKLEELDVLVNNGVVADDLESVKLDLSTAIQQEVGIYQSRLDSEQLTDNEAGVVATVDSRKLAATALADQATTAQSTIEELTQAAVSAFNDLINFANGV